MPSTASTPPTTSMTRGTVVSASSLLSALSRTLAAMSLTDAGVWLNVFSKIVIGCAASFWKLAMASGTPATCVYRLSSAVSVGARLGSGDAANVCLTSRTSTMPPVLVSAASAPDPLYW